MPSAIFLSHAECPVRASLAIDPHGANARWSIRSWGIRASCPFRRGQIPRVVWTIRLDVADPMLSVWLMARPMPSPHDNAALGRATTTEEVRLLRGRRRRFAAWRLRRIRMT
jgi:hypothetical protein